MTDTSGARRARLAIDIGGTFTDVALEHGDGAVTTTKVLTTAKAPEQAVLEGVDAVLGEAGLAPGDIALVIHGTTLATNALIERKGARTALLCTEGHRDSLEMAYENRFAQYDIDVDRPEPLVPRDRRLELRERVGADGAVLLELDEDSVRDVAGQLRQLAVESVAVGLLHSYANPAHERRVAELLAAELPDLPVSLSSTVCPEVREFERQSTAAANAYVRPKMQRYLGALAERLSERGLDAPVMLMTSGGGLTDLETARTQPIRLVESGPAGGAILASRIAAEAGLDRVVSFDMGGTTAKVCLIDDGTPLKSRTFEVDRTYRFQRGSGLPVRVPVIEMVEIGAGGGSIAQVDALGRIAVGPDSAGSDPGPACYGRGGDRPTVTDANVAFRRIDPEGFAGGRMALDAAAAETALTRHVAEPGGLAGDEAPLGVLELVNETMANAARVHAIEWGKELSGRTLIAFGGAAPLHAARLAEKLGITRVLVPAGAGVGSALGFLRAPVAYEVVRSRFVSLDGFDPDTANALLAEMRAEAAAVVARAAPGQALEERRELFMRYRGQGHEIAVALPNRDLGAGDARGLADAFAEAYAQIYGRALPGGTPEILSWTLSLSTPVPAPEPAATPPAREAPAPEGWRRVYDDGADGWTDTAVYRRDALSPGVSLQGPAVVAEDQTTTLVPQGFRLTVDGQGNLVVAA
jgi:N-methylhydantoinase A